MAAVGKDKSKAKAKSKDKSKAKAKSKDKSKAKTKAKSKSKSKSTDHEAVAGPAGDGQDASEDGGAGNDESVERASQGYILFVGNLGYSTKPEHVIMHFGEYVDTDSIVTFRLNTDRHTGKSKGCGFIEFSSPSALHAAVVHVHHSKLHGRVINVELTAGGGGKAAKRQEKILVKNIKFRKEVRAAAKRKHNADNSAEHSGRGSFAPPAKRQRTLAADGGTGAGGDGADVVKGKGKGKDKSKGKDKDKSKSKSKSKSKGKDKSTDSAPPGSGDATAWWNQ
ncbi:uncharacterized protein AMSG_06266 [Thecamonas trahens ATCC 50062]|uniref:RRM domain-containing protein n=1 Tax=Thecamonas trahens ATCC 50062 TaxID=461836 RepID=A0A0L0DCW6_THETB|nr:hypothetical protein AMSG_06266 [Thecamonas trahens ATCC 50062]KNC49956.1 hypothetical protein AMSG_06266 [Thecamonas trahens ATCC 50062]|eukprot:XP_013757431.1 hypothetical protein AMSG_06266 [Thecamonas trahens ATCC 50062]